MDFAVQCRGLSRRFGDFIALDGIDIEVEPGVIYGFLGPNGAGKTTLIRLLTGLDRPSSGTAWVFGHDVESAGHSLKTRTAYLDQQPQFYSWMTGRETVEFVGRLFGLRGRELSRRSEEVLEETGLIQSAKRKVGGYSGGMKQRLGLAQALINKPDLLFLDEPASALDPAGRRDILDIISMMKGRATVFMSTHILADVERVCDQVCVINEGRVAVESSLDSLQQRYARPIFILEPEPDQEEPARRLVSAIKKRPWCNDVTKDHNEIRVGATDTGTASVELLSLAVEYRTRLAAFRRDTPNLEDIFLHLVGDGSRDSRIGEEADE